MVYLHQTRVDAVALKGGSERLWRKCICIMEMGRTVDETGCSFCMERDRLGTKLQI